jgi:hypothetical protein
MDNFGDEILLQIFQRSFSTHWGMEFRLNPRKFIDYNECWIESACDVLGFLRLVEPDYKSPFGCRPTPQLNYHLLEVVWKYQSAFHLGVRPKIFRDNRRQSRKDRKLLKKLIKISGSPDLWNKGSDLSTMLATSCLAHWDQSGDLVPTKALHAQYRYAVQERAK